MSNTLPPGISAIVAAYNEEQRLEPVLDVLTRYPGFSEVIVVDDGSTDDTGRIAQHYPVHYLRNERNKGKGAAMQRAVDAASQDIFFFCDADITGLTDHIIDEIVQPVINGEVDMFVSMRRHRILRFFPFILHLIFLLGGERAVTRSLWNKVPAYYKRRYHIEAALNFYAVHYGNGFAYAYFPELKQAAKEEKFGLLVGLYRRAITMSHVFHAAARARWEYAVTKWLKNIPVPSPKRPDRR